MPATNVFPRILVTVLGVFLSLILLLPASVSAAEQIMDFGVSLEVTKDARLLIEENIVYDFGDAQKHGIYRDIPLKFTDTVGETHDLDVHVREVTDEQGIAYIWKEEYEGDMFRIRIGDPERTITGAHIYTISYEVENAIVHLPLKDELYWNVTGNEWMVPILDVYASVALPQEAQGKELGRACYRGTLGSTETCESGEYGGESVFSSDRMLAPYEGMTVAVGFPKGIVVEPEPTLGDVLLAWLRKYLDGLLTIALPLLIGGFAFREWYHKGRDPKGRGVIVPEYEAPQNLTVLESAYLLDTKITPKDVSAAIIALAIKGAITIVEEESKVLLVFTKKQYRLKKTGNESALVSFEQVLFNAVFSSLEGTPKDETLVGDIKPLQIQVALIEVKKQIGASLTQKKYFTRDPMKNTTLLIFLGGVVALGVVLFMLSTTLNLQFSWNVGLLIPGALILLFMRLMPQKTREGTLVREKLLGLKRYIEVAEKDRIEFHNAPEKTPELFEKLLPYAMLFGLTEIWTKEFADIMKEPPVWYSSPTGSWTPVAFASDLDGFSSSFASATSPSGGGSGGGGFSGGGGGGGGGGSW